MISHNVGITKDMLVMMMKPQDFKDVIDLNLNGVFYASQAAFMGSMMGQKRGRIINVASIVGSSYVLLCMIIAVLTFYFNLICRTNW